MPGKNSEKQSEAVEVNKAWIREFNKFLSDYFRWIVTVIVIIILCLGSFLILKPKYDQTMGYISVLNQRQQVDFDAKNKELNEINALLKEYASIDKSYIDKINAVAPVLGNKEELFSEINHFISGNQLFLQSISLGEEEGYLDNELVVMTSADKKVSSNIRSINVSISVSGTNYQGLKNLLLSLENNLHLMDAPTLVFSPSSDSTTLKLNIYYFKE
jgi:hypothetical protein